ncbi:HAMP domain-containing sensor histidine kinase [Actinocorallia sp. A-T 12471]|uniref:sensor histidine kinase n=1 Tax=Actinocorallia sp. A-T 12471 TaxID=3089813 RepID=UPI0029D2B2AD|nr:HAMP domain-containing sensor histidine kinase [Actinocorallia sp. A-T 12471]MDX6738411.1 HAMP domain-containing sensor histidine kinase [Actinocorallia sp. A-T 12471]
MNRWSIRTRLTVLAATVTALLCLGMAILLTLVLRGRVADLHRESVANSALGVIQMIKRDQVPRMIPSVGPLETLDGVQVVNADGVVVGGTGDLGSKPRVSDLMPSVTHPHATETLCDAAGENCRAIIAMRVYETPGDWFIYVIDEPVPWYISSAYVFQLMLVSLMLIALTAAGTAHTVRVAMEPVSQIRSQAMRIGFAIGEGKGRGRRIALPEHDDELRALAKAANLVLARLEATIDREREFTSNASHDLRSPITAMRTELDEAMLYPEEADWPTTAEKLTGSLDRLSELVEDLLALSRLDAGATVEKEPIDLAELVREEIGRRPEDPRVRIEAQPVKVSGVKVHLARLFTNLLDNAVRHAKDEVVVKVRPDGHEAVLEVINDGDSIPPEMREAIFDRFTRLDASRSKDTGGSGLGLAICRQIAHAHNGTVAALDADTGARFVVRLPRAVG